MGGSSILKLCRALVVSFYPIQPERLHSHRLLSQPERLLLNHFGKPGEHTAFLSFVLRQL